MEKTPFRMFVRIPSFMDDVSRGFPQSQHDGVRILIKSPFVFILQFDVLCVLYYLSVYKLPFFTLHTRAFHISSTLISEPFLLCIKNSPKYITATLPVSAEIRLGAGHPGTKSFATASRPILGPTQPPMQEHWLLLPRE